MKSNDRRPAGLSIRGRLIALMGHRELIHTRSAREVKKRRRSASPSASSTHRYGKPERIGTRLEVEPKQAAVVREIFDLYVAGWSPGRIAAELNRRGIASPGSTWKRTVRRARGWMQNAVRGDDFKATGVLGNTLYTGKFVWNCSQWAKNPDTGPRKYLLRPEARMDRAPHAGTRDCVG